MVQIASLTAWAIAARRDACHCERPAPNRRATKDSIGLSAVFLDARGAQPRQSVLVDRALPAQELVDREGISVARLLKAEQPPPDRGNDLGLAADDPAPGVSGGKVRDGQGTAVGADHI